eukprot:CAMPEP_0201484514 /NCGR_PEP_ID=MMETSP0151_2-20130828/8691_1 /ASSEMBLY_ACC=CAM_ASM_000257 /TAXON_ID=200890 /ORGANISM="Paramoeba atlantica, Strain 621/1 / CCAP 1560/9" /LENGTH=131 /DNA_ID=CAMNT_0047868221 /DNA_START=66 /DNA_END=461 /DNA_ORIENTATION=-
MAQSITVRTKKFMSNPLLQRKQFVIQVVHPGRSGVSKSELKAKLAQMYKIDNPQLVVTFGLRTQFGGGRTSGFGLIYDNLESLKKFEPSFRKVRMGIEEKTERESRKLRKDRKNRAKKKIGKNKSKILYGK